MKKSDYLVIACFLLLFAPFFLSPALFSWYETANGQHAYLASFIKFAVLATFGECLGLRIRTGSYSRPGFGIMPRAIVWGFLGIVIKIAFVIFGTGAPVMLASMGVTFPDGGPGAILAPGHFGWLKILAAFSVSATMNLLFAPVFMAFHRVTDLHILHTGGTLRGFMKPFRFGHYVQETDWKDFWNFVVKKTIPLFWIPAHTLTFLLPESYRVLVAALLSVALGVLLSVAAIRQRD